MAVSEAQKRASERYRKESVRQLTTRFYPTEADLWEWLSAQPNKQGYIKRLIREDMESHTNK
ncbi:hypothetical protein [Olsenella sp. Marseille-P4559]|uniref:hypothetical protein n=1 Tax=Olsenella sp. Marseille-P4559 TaxID=2364795 RepID=UPI001031528B|nr:hypothetical protein [Olsenella sp. Marseille-P4559]